MVKIIEEKRAPNPRRVRIFLAEKAITVPFEHLDIASGAHKSAAFCSLSPVQRVPVLVLDDGTAISESIAICRYFEAQHPEPALFGRTPIEIATVEMWNRIAELNFLFPVAQIFRHTHPAMANWEVPQVPAWAEANRPRVEESLRILDARLAAVPFLAGDAFSVADITAFVAADFMKVARLEIPQDLPNFRRWHSQISSRESSKA